MNHTCYWAQLLARALKSRPCAEIEPESLPHVFERFRQADLSSSRRVGGLCLGLALVKHLVELHGGMIEAESAGACQGATFTVRLPLRAIYAAPPEEHKALDAMLPARSESLAGGAGAYRG